MALSEAQLNQLYTEITTDPSGIGLAAAFAANNHPLVASLINQSRATVSIEKSYVTARDLIASLVPTEYIGLTQPQRDYLALLPALGTVDIRTGSSLRNALNSVFAAGTGTRTAYTALASRNGSRAEQLFGVDTVVTAGEVTRAGEMNA
jgi:hypothetical protein